MREEKVGALLVQTVPEEYFGRGVCRIENLSPNMAFLKFSKSRDEFAVSGDSVIFVHSSYKDALNAARYAMARMG